MAIKRRRLKHTTSLADRLTENVEQLRRQLSGLAPGPERDHLERRIRQSETASRIEEWIRSPGLQPPIDVRNLAGKVE